MGLLGVLCETPSPNREACKSRALDGSQSPTCKRGSPTDRFWVTGFFIREMEMTAFETKFGGNDCSVDDAVGEGSDARDTGSQAARLA